MAAYAALTSLINTIHQIPHYSFPPIALNIQEVEYLTEHVTFLQEFLEGYKSPAAYTDEADPLEMRIADAAYAVEYFIESHIVDIIQQHRLTSSIHPRLQRVRLTATSTTRWIPLRAIDDMNSIKKDVMKMKKEKTIVVEAHASASGGSSSRSSIMVGQNDVLLEILDKLTGGHNNRQAIPIVGMGDIGKTTLAKTVFGHPLVKEHFDICAWATISQQHNTREILCELLSQANKKSKDDLSYMSEGELEVELHKYLSQGRFLIVLDDMWGIKAWENIQHSFPENNNGSRIVVTTRLSNLGSQLDNSYCLEMKFLDEVNSWDLFTKSVFGEESCPLGLTEIRKEIVENCRGLPLSIVVVGSLLKKLEHTQQCWESIRTNSTSVVLNSENEDFCLRILNMSYNHLPVHLKPCFLYMGVFEEDRAVHVSTLVKLWVSEGFLKPVSDKSLETIAKEYLNDLVERNLVLVHELGSTGSIKYCKLHDLLRDLCLREAQKECFYYVIGQNEFRDLHNQRCFVIPRSTSKEKVHYASSGYRPLAHSFICDSKEVLPLPNSTLLRTLKTFDRDASGSHDYEYRDVFGNINLRYLAIGVRLESKFPYSVGRLWNLHTLVVFHPRRFTAPGQIWTMPQLRHVEFHKGTLKLPNPPNGYRIIMENLQTLKGVRELNCDEASSVISNIKKLGVSEEKIPSNLIRLSKLESFLISIVNLVNLVVS